MQKLFPALLLIILIASCTPTENDYLVKYYEAETDQSDTRSGYLNARGDTIVPIGRYQFCYTDTIRDLGMVVEQETGKIIGIDREGTELYEVFNYDNGPDYLESGLFRIVKNEMIGYADATGHIVIEPRFKCARPFAGDRAQVADQCELVQEFDHSSWESDAWYFIGKDGRRVGE